MKIYDYPQAPNPRRVRIFLAEKGIEIPFETVDITKRTNREPAFLAKNPLGGIPVLELDDGTCIAESVAICRYFEALHPEPPLFGTTPLEQARIEMWLRRVELGMMVPIGMVWIHGHPLTAGLLKQIPEAAEQNRHRAAQFYEFLDKELAGREFLAGDDYTVADAVGLATLDFGTGLVGVPYDESFAHLARWHSAMRERPSARA